VEGFWVSSGWQAVGLMLSRCNRIRSKPYVWGLIRGDDAFPDSQKPKIRNGGPFDREIGPMNSICEDEPPVGWRGVGLLCLNYISP
jgi:hypothetical protein